MIIKNNRLILKTLIAGMLTASLNLQAVEVEQTENGISFNSLQHSNYKLTLVSPTKEIYTFNLNNKNFSITTDMLNLKGFDNGLYKYELTPIVKTGDLGANVRTLDDSEVTQEFQRGFSSQDKYSGSFSIIENKLLEKIEESMNKDQVFLDDLIVDGSACIGMDCLNGESFGFDTLRLKENNLRIKFDDTSSETGSFPNNDWQITANDSSNGGANKFSIDDITNGKTPFTIEANTPSNTLYVDSVGRIGIKTATPVVDLHIVQGNSPTLRLEQDGSSGFTPQTWDIVGNEANFFIRDVTNGSKLPFRIKPGAPDDSIFIDAAGEVGIGTENPSANLHIKSTTSGVDEMLKIENNGGSYITMANTSTTGSWFLTHEDASPNSFNISYQETGGALTVPMRMTSSGNVTVLGTLTTSGTTCGTGCDLVFTEGYKLPTIEEHAAQMWKNSYLPNVGPTVENEPFNITEKTGGMLNELEKAHIYIEQLNARIYDKENELNTMRIEFKDLKQMLVNDFELRLAKLEQK